VSSFCSITLYNVTFNAPYLVPTLNLYCNNTGVERLACLQALPADTLLNITNTVTSWLPVVDGIYLVNDTLSQLSQGPSAINSVPFMAGFMPDEGQSFVIFAAQKNDSQRVCAGYSEPQSLQT
jgi:carboxylesterase type B